MGEIVAIQLKGKKRGPMKPLTEAEAVPGIGLRSGRNGRPGGKRQVLVIPIELLEAFDLEPGQVREQITTRAIDVMSLTKGDRLHIGSVILEATGECTPCEMLEDIRPGLKDAMNGQRGMLFRVLAGGYIRVGDIIELAEREVSA